MTAVTVWGTCAVEGQPAAHYFRSGSLREAELFERMHEQLPASGVPVEVGHAGERVGQLVYGEITDDGRVDVVCVLDDDTLTRINSDIFFSPELVCVGPADRLRAQPVSIAARAGLTAIALCTNPATVAATPIQLARGDVRNSADRSGWPLGWRGERPLLSRCVDYHDGDWRHRTFTRIINRRATSDPSTPGAHGWVGYDGRPLTRAIGASLASHPAVAVR